MTVSINYNEIYNQVETELGALRTEKELLLEQQHRIEQRLGAINEHQAKLQRVFDSLADLLPMDGFRQDAVSLIELVANENLSDDGAAVAVEPTLANGSAPSFAETPNETDDRAENVASSVVGAEPSGQTPEFVETAEDFAQPTSIPASSHDRADVSEELSPNVMGAREPTVRQLTDFDRRDFFERFPHVTRTHPVHILTGKLLEYFGYGLKLAEIARLIEQLGYQHNSRNFTDSVHSALKNKRKATGEFRFNAAKSVWELSQWQNERLETEKAESAKTATGNGNAPTTRLTEQVETQIAKQLGKAKKQTAAASSEKAAGASTASNNQPELSGEQGKQRAVKVYKAQRR